MKAVSTAGCYALGHDGSVWAWGSHPDPADNDRTWIPGRVVPEPVAGFSDIIELATGSWMGGVSLYGLRADGSVWSWGDNTGGQLGDGTEVARTHPVRVSGLDRVVSIAAGDRAAYAVRSDGSVWAWGRNRLGQLGDGTLDDRPTPVRISGLPAVSRVYPVDEGAYALAVDGSLWAWGNNATFFWGEVQGSLGVGDGPRVVSAPTRVRIPVPVAKIETSPSSTYAVASDGSLWVWGANNHGQLGLGMTSTQSTPVRVPGLDGIIDISASLSTAAALRSDGTVWMWGDGSRGQMGDGKTDSYSTPRWVPSVQGARSVRVNGGTVYAVLGDSSDDCGPTIVDVQAGGADEFGPRVDSHAAALTRWATFGASDQVARLLDQGADPNEADPSGDPALFHAASNGHANIVRLLLERGCLPDTQGTSGPPLLAAAGAGHVEVVQELLDHGCEPNLAQRGQTALMAASAEGNDEVVELLVQAGADVDARDSSGKTALYFAASEGRRSTVDVLLALGANPNAGERSSGSSPLAAAASRFDVEVVQALLRAGAEAADMYRLGYQLLYHDARGPVPVPVFAVQDVLDRPNLTIIQSVERAPGSPGEERTGVSLVDTPGWAIEMFRAAGSGNREQVLGYLEHGVDVNAVDQDGDGVLRWLLGSGDLDMLRLLLERGADPNAASTSASGRPGFFVLHAYAEHGWREGIEMLAQHGARVEASGPGGVTPLMLAAGAGHATSVEALHGCGADVDAVDDDGDSVLYYAASRGRYATVESLLALGADASPRAGSAGYAPLTFAAALASPFGRRPANVPQSNYTKTVVALLRAGADAGPMYRAGFVLGDSMNRIVALDRVHRLVAGQDDWSVLYVLREEERDRWMTTPSPGGSTTPWSASLTPPSRERQDPPNAASERAPVTPVSGASQSHHSGVPDDSRGSVGGPGPERASATTAAPQPSAPASPRSVTWIAGLVALALALLLAASLQPSGEASQPAPGGAGLPISGELVWSSDLRAGDGVEQQQNGQWR